MPGTYARAALPLLPGASRLPFVAGGGGEMPSLSLVRDGVRVRPDALAAYDRLCGFTLRDALPPTYLHVLAFPLHMAVMTDGRFPFGAIGLVHVRNRIEVLRPARLGETFAFSVRPTPVSPHARGVTFALVTEVSVGADVVWRSESVMLRRRSANGGHEGGGSEAPPQDDRGSVHLQDEQNRTRPRSVAEWRLAEDLGRRYAAVSGDRNPIHLHALTAKAFGFGCAIAHGMWTKARCLAALEPRLPDAYTVDVTFRKPILLPGAVRFAMSQTADATAFAVSGVKDQNLTHLEGTVA